MPNLLVFHLKGEKSAVSGQLSRKWPLSWDQCRAWPPRWHTPGGCHLHLDIRHSYTFHRWIEVDLKTFWVNFTPPKISRRWILVCSFKILIRFFDRKLLLLMSQSEFGWTSAQQLKYADSIGKITKQQRKSAIFFRKFHREDKISETYTSRGGSEVGDILLNSTAHPPSTSKSTPPRCIFWTHRGCSTPRCQALRQTIYGWIWFFLKNVMNMRY